MTQNPDSPLIEEIRHLRAEQARFRNEVLAEMAEMRALMDAKPAKRAAPASPAAAAGVKKAVEPSVSAAKKGNPMLPRFLRDPNARDMT